MDIEKFLILEKDNNLFDYEIQGFKYWHYIRFSVFQEILKQVDNVGLAHTSLEKEKYFKRFYLKLKQLPNFLFKNPIWFLKEKDLIILNSSRRVKNGKYFECLYTDILINHTNYSYYVFENPILEKHFKPIGTRNIRYLDYITFRVAIYKEFMRKFIRFSISETDKEQVLKIINLINALFNIYLDEKRIIHLVENVVLAYNESKKYYKKILDKVKPKVIIQLASYSFDRYLINEIAKKRGIPVIELQHGTMGKYHVAYNFAEKMDLPTFPDYIFLFGQFWKDNTRLPIDDSKIKVVGWPYYEQKIKTYKRNNEVKSARKNILFISQGTVGKELSKAAINLADKIDLSRYQITYKLHPGEYTRWKNEYPWLVNSNMEIIDNNEHDMHYYFAKSDVQIGVYSTAIYEGIGYGLRTFIYKLYGHETMEELYKNGYAVLFESIDELIVNLEEENEKIEYQDLSYFWKDNSINNIRNELKKIIQGGK